jgi:hypothetical protein
MLRAILGTNILLTEYDEVLKRNAADFAGAEKFGVEIIAPASFLKLIRRSKP